MTISLQPMGDRVVVALRDLPEKTGLILRVARSEYAREADVIAVGPDVRDIAPGDIVLVTTLAGQEVGGNLIVPESSILGMVQ